MELGTLENVDLRSIWTHEALNFTPWLAENIDRLADVLGLGKLTVEGVEHRIGPFSLDILARTDDDRPVIVENQLEASDHTHLGQCLTYAAGVGAYAVVWVLPELLPDHRAALDWLNVHTDEEVHFFGVQVGVVRIGESAPAPVFRVESRPNDWQKRARTGSQSTAAGPSRDWEYAHRALELLPHGMWTSTADIAEVVGTTTQWVGRHFFNRRHIAATLRMLTPDGAPWPHIRLAGSDEVPTPEALRNALAEQGLVLDELGRAPAGQRLDAEQLVGLVREDSGLGKSPDPDLAGE